ncbi:MAG: hypothetical protein DRJ64_08880, partial [Thermoprotei archaeon]
MGLALLLNAVPVMAEQEKLTICHKGESMQVPDSALGGHLRHGDSIGECATGNPPDTQQADSQNQSTATPSSGVSVEEQMQLLQQALSLLKIQPQQQNTEVPQLSPQLSPQ